MPVLRRSAAALLLAVPFALAGCSGGGNPMRDLAMASGVTGGEPRAAPDFISRTRTENKDYVPVGTAAPKRVYRSKTADEVKASEADLDRTRTRIEAAGRAPAAQ